MLRGIKLACASGLVAASLVGLARTQYGGPCTVPDNGTGTVDLPPVDCGYLSPTEFHEILNGLPPGTTVRINPTHSRFVCPNGPGTCESPGGSLGGSVDAFGSRLTLVMLSTTTGAGFGRRAGPAFSRTIDVPVQCEVHTAPRTPGQPVQTFATDFFALQGGIAGDPDFDSLNITAGTSFVGPSPGSTTLTQQPSGGFAVDSFFDISYRIDFVGATGGAFAGLSGSTLGTVAMQAFGATAPSFCNAVDGSLAACPCANPGDPESGCDSPVPVMQGGGTTGGIRLDVVSQQTAPTNAAVVAGSGYPPASVPGVVVLRGDSLDSASPAIFGDGLRCVGTPLVRLGASQAVAGVSTHTFGHGTMTGSGSFYYQLWYRSQPPSYCDPVADYNLSNGRTLTW
jgi:hypothetical protein